MGDYRSLRVWREAQDLAVEIYQLTDRFPSRERFGLTQQVRRSVVSVSSNIAEGAGRGRQQEFLNFVRIARGSLKEMESQTHLGIRLGFVREEDASATLLRAERVSRMLSGILAHARPRGKE